MNQWLLTETTTWLAGTLGKMLLGTLGKRMLGGIGKWLLLALLAGTLLALLATCMPGKGAQDAALAYSGPVEIGINQGEYLPGTDIQYLGKIEEGAQLSIGGQQALKKAGDSLNWKGDLIDGVAADLSLRVVLITEDEIHVAGSAEVAIADPAPQPALPNELAPVHYKLPVAHRVKKGAAIPGTVFIYAGRTEQGAHLANIEGYPYREVGDSIVWKAKLQEGVWLELLLRTVLITDTTLNVAGTADLWIEPQTSRMASLDQNEALLWSGSGHATR